MRKWLNAYFDFSKQEFNGLLVLMVLILLISATPYLYSFVKPEPNNSAAELGRLFFAKRIIKYRERI